MSWGIQQFGIGSWGSDDLIVINHIPVDNATGVSRTPTISFILSSENNDIVLSSINLTANGIPLITNGVFINAVGAIDNTNPLLVLVDAIVINAFGPSTFITINVVATNLSNEIISSGASWSFTTINTSILFSAYIVRDFERILRVGN